MSGPQESPHGENTGNRRNGLYRISPYPSVARGQRTEFEFVLEKNLYVEDVHIASVRASCSCTTPEIKTDALKTHQKGVILAKYNTATFLGPKGATLTVIFDKPFLAEVQLHVRGFIRSDVLLQPGSVDFASIDQGGVNERAFTISHTGRQDWRISEVRSANPHLSARATEVARSLAQVTYQIVVRLDRLAERRWWLTRAARQGWESAVEAPESLE